MAQELREGQTGTAPDGTRVIVRNGQIVPLDAPAPTGPEAAGFTSLGGGWYRGPDGGSYQEGRGGAMVKRAGGSGGAEGDDVDLRAAAELRGRLVLSLGSTSEANQRMEAIQKSGYTYNDDWGARMLEAIPGDGGTAARVVGGDDYQRLETASRSFESAMLPVFSGAAVTPTEATRFIRANLPSLGDSQETLETKARNRRLMINGAATLLGQEIPYPDLGVFGGLFGGGAQEMPYEQAAPIAAAKGLGGGAGPDASGAPAAPPNDGRTVQPADDALAVAPGEYAADYVARFDRDGDNRASVEEMQAAGWTFDYGAGKWFPPGADMGGSPPPPAGPQGGGNGGGIADLILGGNGQGTEGYRTALGLERANADLVAGAGGGYGITDAVTAPLNDEMAYAAGFINQGLGNIGRRLTGRDIEITAGERARASRDVMREDQDRFAREHPVQNIAGQVAGGLAFGPGGAARSLVGRMAQGAGMGGAYGFADAEGSVSERLPSAGGGAVFGAAAVPAVERIAAPALNALARPVGEFAQSSGRFLGRQVGRAGNALNVPGSQQLLERAAPNPLQTGVNRFADRSPQDVNALNANAQRFRAEEIQPTFADVVNDGGRGTMRALATRQTPARQQAREFTEGRAAGLQDRVSTQSRRVISDDPRQPREMREEFVARGRERAAPLYEEAYARPGSPRSPLTDELMQRPSMREAMGRAQRIAREEGRDPTTLGFQFDDAGNVLHVREPSMQTMDYIKRGLDDYLESFRDSVTGRLNLDTAGRAAQGTRAAFREELRRLNPKYGEALDAYGDEAQMTEAVDIGERFLTMDAADFVTAVNRLSPDQRQIARAAARRAVERQAGTQGQAPGVAQRLSNGREQGARAQALLGEDASRLQSAMGAEIQALRNAQAINPAQGSPTSMNAQDALGAAGAARDVATGNVVGLAGRAMNAIRSRGFSDQEAQAIVEAATDPAQTDQLVSMLAERMTRREARNLARAIRYQITTNPPSNQQR